MKFLSEGEVVHYVRQQLKALPAGWSSFRESENPLVWRLERVPLDSLGSFFRLRVSGDWELFVLEHDNSDQGPFRLCHVLLNAKIIDSEALDHFSLAEVVRAVIAECRPNQWGLT
jgi:hypothetical protein